MGSTLWSCLILSAHEKLNGPKYVKQNGVFNYLHLLQVWLSILILKKEEHKITDSSHKTWSTLGVFRIKLCVKPSSVALNASVSIKNFEKAYAVK